MDSDSRVVKQTLVLGPPRRQSILAHDGYDVIRMFHV